MVTLTSSSSSRMEAEDVSPSEDLVRPRSDTNRQRHHARRWNLLCPGDAWDRNPIISWLILPVMSNGDRTQKSVPVELNSNFGPNSGPVLTSGVQAIPNPATVNQPVTFTAFAADPLPGSLSYSWNFFDGTSTTSASPTVVHTYTSAGTYDVLVTIIDNYDNSNHGSVNEVVGDEHGTAVVGGGGPVGSGWRHRDCRFAADNQQAHGQRQIYHRRPRRRYSYRRCPGLSLTFHSNRAVSHRSTLVARRPRLR